MKFEDILDAAKEIYQETGRLEDITFNSLVKHIGCTLSGSFGRKIEGRYRSEVEEINGKYDVKIPPIALLRAEVGGQDIEDHPLLKAKKVYDDFSISMFDWGKFITIPLEIGIDEAELLGIIWSDARKRNRDAYNGELNVVGRSNDFELYNEFVGPRVKEVFNLSGEVTTLTFTFPKLTRTRKGKTYEGPKIIKEPCVRLGSKAVSTWLSNDMGFPNLEAILEKLPLKRQKLAFMEGYIAGKGIPILNGIYPKIEVYHGEKSDTEFIKKTLNELGFNIKNFYGRVHKGGFDNFPEYMRYSINLYAKQLKELNILNPRHKKVLYG